MLRPKIKKPNRPKSFPHNNKGLSTVVTTLIILVISVLLATVVTYYAMNMVSTRVIQEDGRITQLHIWVNCTDGNCTTAEATMLFKNTGGRDILLDKITVRYQDIPWTSIYYTIFSSSITETLVYNCTVSAGADYNFTGSTINFSPDGSSTQNYTFTQASQDICLETGNSILIYIETPDTIDCLDIGTPVPVGVHTSNAIYYKEVTVSAQH